MLRVPHAWPDLTPAWMSEALSRSFPGAVVDRVEISDLADGTNRRARALLGYRAGPGPASVFVKREGRMLNRLALLALGAWDAEARLFASGVALPIEHPVPYAAAVDRHRLATVVVMEDVTLRAGQANDATLPLSPEEVRSGLRGLARLHAAYWGRRVPAAIGFLRPWRLGRRWAPVSLASLARGVRLVRSHGSAGILPMGVTATELERGFRGWSSIAASGPQTVLHGDPHPGNTYGLPGEETGFYDWQLVRMGNWSHDVGYFIASSLGIAERRAHERELLERYLGELARADGSPPNRDDAWSLYRRTPAYGLGTWLHTLSGGGFQPVDQCLVVIERFASAYVDHGAGR